MFLLLQMPPNVFYTIADSVISLLVLSFVQLRGGRNSPARSGRGSTRLQKRDRGLDRPTFFRRCHLSDCMFDPSDVREDRQNWKVHGPQASHGTLRFWWISLTLLLVNIQSDQITSADQNTSNPSYMITPGGSRSKAPYLPVSPYICIGGSKSKAPYLPASPYISL